MSWWLKIKNAVGVATAVELLLIVVLIFVIGIALLMMSVSMVAKANAADLAYGDSIALGTGNALRVQVSARVGASSCSIAARAPGGHYEHVVISAGINDPPGACLEAIRKAVSAGQVVWVLPAAINSARAHVLAVAPRWGDKTVSYSCAGGCSRSSFHPGSYAVLAAEVRRAWGS